MSAGPNTTARPVIRRALPGEAGRVADLTASAFENLAASEWLVPDRHARRSVLAGNFGIWTEHATTSGHGHIDVVDDPNGVAAAAVWFHMPMPTPEDYHRRLLGAVGPNLDRFRTLDALFDVYHPPAATFPHHYAAFMAVRADRQGQGLGGALLDHHHAELDAQGIPSYLEAESTGSRDLCKRRGYSLFTGGSFALGDGPARFWPMLRQPVRPPDPPDLSLVDGGGDEPAA